LIFNTSGLGPGRAAFLFPCFAQTKAWQRANPEKVRASKSAWRAANREKIRAAARMCEYKRTYQRVWQKANPDKVREYDRAYHAGEPRKDTCSPTCISTSKRVLLPTIGAFGAVILWPMSFLNLFMHDDGTSPNLFNPLLQNIALLCC